MAHSHKSIRDHARRRNQPYVDNEIVAQQLEDLVKPCAFKQLGAYRGLGMRERLLSLPLMVAVVLSLLWRQVPSVRELHRMLARENLLWAKVTQVSQQALCQRFLTFPASLFEEVLQAQKLRNCSVRSISWSHLFPAVDGKQSRLHYSFQNRSEIQSH